MKVQGLTPILNVSNLGESFAWFEKLRWRTQWAWGDPGGFGCVGNENSEIFLCVKARARAAGRCRATPADVDAAHALALQAGVTVTLAPMNMEWNVRECHLRHPDGHTFRVSCGLPEE